jgi:hypothetical protein
MMLERADEKFFGRLGTARVPPDDQAMEGRVLD